MQRNQQTTLSALQPGDRFYFAGKKKNIFTLDSKEPFFYKYQSKYKIHYANCIPDSALPGAPPVAFKTFHNSRLTRVIFLRNINDNI